MKTELPDNVMEWPVEILEAVRVLAARGWTPPVYERAWNMLEKKAIELCDLSDPSTQSK